MATPQFIDTSKIKDIVPVRTYPPAIRSKHLVQAGLAHQDGYLHPVGQAGDPLGVPLATDDRILRIPAARLDVTGGRREVAQVYLDPLA